MSDEKPPVRHAGSQAATRAAATLNWLAIGGQVGAVVSDVIAVYSATIWVRTARQSG